MKYDANGNPTGLVDHDAEGKSVQLDILRKPRLTALLGSYLSEIQAAEDAAWSLFTGRFLASSTGFALASWGKLVGELPNGEPDDAYRTRIMVRIAVNRSSGNVPDFYRIGKLVFGANVPFIVQTAWKTVSIQVFAPITTGVSRAQMLLWFRRAKVSGDKLSLWRSLDTHPLICRSKNNPVSIDGLDSKAAPQPGAGKMMGGF